MGASPIFILYLFASAYVSARVEVFPPDQVISKPGGSATFYCIPSVYATNFQWYLNGTLLDMANLGDTVMEYSSTDNNDPIGTLQFTNLLQNYDMTEVECTAIYSSGVTSSISNSVILLLLTTQMDVVLNVDLEVNPDSTISLNWTTPLYNLTDPVMSYCVNVINSANITVHSKCGITDTEYNDYPIPQDSNCRIYLFTVIPVNQAGHQEGDSDSFFGDVTPPKVMKVSESLLHNMLAITLTMSSPVCQSELTLDDHDTEDIVILEGPDLNIENSTITIIMAQLTANRLYDVTVVASNVAGSATSYTVISTHDIVSTTFTDADGSGNIKIAATYSEHSKARGALFIFMLLTESDVDISRSVILTLEKSISHNYVLSAGQYRVFVYDIEQDGTLSNGVDYPAVTDNVLVNNTDSSFEPTPITNVNCNISNAITNIISAECYSSTSEVVGFQLIVQPRNVNKLHTLYASHTTDFQTAASVRVEENGLYLVSILPIMQERGLIGSGFGYYNFIMTSSTTNYSESNYTSEPQTGKDQSEALIIVGPVLIIILISVVIMIIAAAVCCRKMQNGRRRRNFKEMPTSTNEASGAMFKRLPQDAACAPITSDNSADTADITSNSIV